MKSLSNRKLFNGLTAVLAVIGLVSVSFRARSQTQAATIQLTEDQISKEALQALVTQQIHIWNNPNAAERKPEMQVIYQDNVAFFDHDGSVTGLKELNARITVLQQKFTGFKFSLIKIDNSNNVVRYYWNFGPESDPAKIAGMDLIILEKSKIRSINVFLDRLPAPSKN